MFQLQLELEETLVDYDKRETELKQKLWHLRLDKFLKEIVMPAEACVDLEVIQADIPRYWLEEAQHIELTNDPKHDQLNDIVDKIELIYKAYHQCTTTNDVQLLTEQAEKVYPRLKFERITTET